MSASAEVDLTWADGEYRFRLPIGQLRELQDKTGAGPFAIYKRLADGTWFVDDIRESIRLGLIGGGMQAEKALLLVKRYVDDRPLGVNVLTAQSILLAAVIGVPEDQVGKARPEETATEATGASSSPKSTARAARSAGRRGRSTSAPSGNSPQPSPDTTEARA